MQTPCFWSILTAKVRYSEELSDFQKILFSEITSLTNSEWYCFAKNSYFAEVFKKDKIWISKNIGHLKNTWFITIQDTLEERKIYCNIDFIIGEGLSKKTRGVVEKDNGGVVEKDNAIYNDLIIQDFIITSDEKNKKEKIENFEIFKSCLNIPFLQEKYFYKIWDQESLDRTLSDFWIYCEDSWKYPLSTTAQARFSRYLSPNFETEEDIKNMKSDYFRKRSSKPVLPGLRPDSFEENKKKESEIENTKFLQVESTLTQEQKQNFLKKAENLVLELTNWKWKLHRSFGLMVQNKYKKIVLENA